MKQNVIHLFIWYLNVKCVLRRFSVKFYLDYRSQKMEYRYERCESVSKPIDQISWFLPLKRHKICSIRLIWTFWKIKQVKTSWNSWLLFGRGRAKVTDVLLSGKCQTKNYFRIVCLQKAREKKCCARSTYPHRTVYTISKTVLLAICYEQTQLIYITSIEKYQIGCAVAPEYRHNCVFNQFN